MNKTAIKNFSVWARKKLLDDVAYQAKQRGVSADGIATPLPQSTGDLQFFEIGTKSPARVTGEEINQRNALVDAIRRKECDSDYRTAYNAVIEEIAYTWFNRLVAIRFMEINDYLPSRVRVLSAENSAKHEPDMVTTPFETDLEFTDQEQDMILRLKDQNKLDELFRYLFIRQCNKLHEILPKVFEQTSDYTEMLLNISFTDKNGIVYHLVHDIPESDFNISTLDSNGNPTGQVEIIGWLYQYYNTALNEQVYDGNLSKSRISKELLPAATTIYTPDWVVQYMIQNSLGRLWLEGHPNDSLKTSWKYYLDEAEQEPEVQAQLDEIRKEYRTLNPQAIRVIDPCAGSGHILVRLFDTLMQIYEAQGYTQRDAVQSILKNNLYGLDIDERAAQLASFAVMMKARQYDRRIFSRGIQLHVYAIVESNNLSSMWTKGNRQMAKLFDCMKDAKEYGSILHVPEMDFDTLRQQVTEKAKDPNNLPAENVILKNQLPQVLALIDVAEVLAQKYDTVVTNPPYLGSSRFSPKLDVYVKKNYAEEKSDLSMVMLKKAMVDFSRKNTFIAFITTTSWMFLSSFEKLRKYMFSNLAISSLVDYGTELFDGKVGHNPIVSWVNRNTQLNYKLTAIRLVDYCYSRRDEKKPEFFEKRNRYTAEQSNFAKVPGFPVAYWVSEAVFKTFESDNITLVATQKTRISTGDNDRFMRKWYEVSREKMLYPNKWIPCPKGGDYRKWYGNIDLLLNWENDGQELKAFGKAMLGDERFFMKRGLTWTVISSKKTGFRVVPDGCICDHKGPLIYVFDERNTYYLLGILNSKYSEKLLHITAPTLGFEWGAIAKTPWIVSEKYTGDVNALVQNNVTLSKSDWDAFETSWDFQYHPIVRKADSRIHWGDDGDTTIEYVYHYVAQDMENRFQQLKENEEELNRIFIDIYGLQDELTPEVEDKDVTVRRADLGRDIRSLLSYAVGCMFGRYSIYKDGLIFAGEPYSLERFVEKLNGRADTVSEDEITRAYHNEGIIVDSLFYPDEDNAIPITDEPYFEDDIVSQLCKWLTTVFGPSTLEENLKFIADALGNKGNTSREVIRNYFLNDFFKDHCKIYQKRPIYWLFDSGRQNGFKCLVYMHRWDADTAGNVRVEYLHKLQRIYEREIQRAQEVIDAARDTREVARANKRKDKLQKQLKETQDYDARLGHIALSRISIDLDDGVKVNYEKVQTGKDGQKMPILAKI